LQTVSTPLGLLFLALVPHLAFASDCNQPPGKAIGEIVPTKDTARAIYRAIAAGRHDKVSSSNDILVNDDGDHWEVFQYPKKGPTYEDHHGLETIRVVAGGGTLELDINKCDASVLGSYAR
jgi:hypothetical protein